MNTAITIFLSVAAVIIGLIWWAIWAGRGNWEDTGRNKSKQTQLKNGWRRVQHYFEQVDLEREGRFRWKPYSEYTLISPTGKEKKVDTTDYGM